MTCYRPITAFKPADGGPVSFVDKKDHREIQLPCGQCIGCRIRKREEWALRCYCESKMHRNNCFVTLTYNDENLPSDGSLNYTHFQLFMKRMRKHYGSFRFFMCGEYGENTGRPHYHALFFGLDIVDRVKCNSLYSRDDIYKSETVNSLWGKGECRIGEVTYESARYCAVYTTKRITGEMADVHYGRVNTNTGELYFLVPEFGRMSLKPGIGYPWLEKYWKDIYWTGNNAVIVAGKKKPVPRFFDLKMDAIAADVLDETKFDRYKEAMKRAEHNTEDRLAVREEVAHRKAAFDKERFRHAL